ncbi:MAG TPA: RluA family pseudouridine synthase [Anaerolineae bacterium]|nr:RluA family pseudouridine synthase [Anaerolineae bacterium]
MSDRIETLIVKAGESGRLDRLVAARLPDLSRTAVQRLIGDGFITRNGAPCEASDKIAAGDEIMVRVPPPTLTALIAEDIPLAIVYEDDDVIVIDKPAGLVVHPAAGHASGTLVNAVMGHVPDLAGIGGEVRPGIVHRLDKDTSGLMIVAKNDRALHLLQDQFKSRTVKKVYVALVEGIVEPREGVIDASIGRNHNHRKKMAVTSDGRSARTRYRVKKIYRDPPVTLIECYPETGRTHQIRVHFAWQHHPLVGDTIYGKREPRFGLTRHFLHAASLALTLPNGEARAFSSPLPIELQAVLAGLTSAEE